MHARDIGGVVLSAGASSRMGQPKALLETPAGIPLATHQANLLMAAGCARTVIVVGDASVAHALADDRVVLHPEWHLGRVSSLQAGLRALESCSGGVVVLPVDTVGLSPLVLRQLILPHSADVLRPVRDGDAGQVAWLSATVVNEVLSLSSTPDVRLNTWLADRTEYVHVTHPVGTNANTPAEWENARKLLDEELV